MIALTATASPPVREDIVATLGLRKARQIVRGFDRPNISLQVHRYADESAKRRALDGPVDTGSLRKTIGVGPCKLTNLVNLLQGAPRRSS